MFVGVGGEPGDPSRGEATRGEHAQAEVTAAVERELVVGQQRTFEDGRATFAGRRIADMVELGPDELRPGAVARGALTFPGESDAALFAIRPEEAQRGAVVHDLELGWVDRVGLFRRTSVAEVTEDEHRVSLVELPVRHEAGGVRHDLVTIGEGEQEVLRVHRRTQHGPGENHWETVVVVGRVVGRAPVHRVDHSRRCPADDRGVGALGHVVGASGGTDSLEVRVGEADYPVEPHSRGQDRQLRTPQVSSDDPIVEEHRWGVVSVRARSVGSDRQRRTRGVGFHLLVVTSIAGLLGHLVLKRRGLRSGFGVWLLIYVRSARIAAVLNRTLIGRIAATADGEQRDDQERDQEPHSRGGSTVVFSDADPDHARTFSRLGESSVRCTDMAFNEAFPMERNAYRSAVPARRSGPPCSAASWLLVLGAHLFEHLEVLAAVVGGEVAGRERDPMDRAAEAGDPLTLVELPVDR